jgi:solute carrier family 36 (proton-coupled amino acid transporter)
LPKAFKNGGLVFSVFTLTAVALVCTLCFHLLLVCRKQVGGGYGEIGEAVFGRRFRDLVLFSIFISQIGFVCACLIFTGQNLASFLHTVTHGQSPLSGNALVGLQLVVLIPLAFVRNISKLGPTALVADICILIGLVYIWWYTIDTLSITGMHSSVVFFNPSDFTLTLGSAIFTFEGIGLLLPIQSSMAEPRKFDRLLYVVMVIITIVFASVGALCYATFGINTHVEVLTNFPQDSHLLNAVQCLYSLAVLGSAPVQLFPAIRIAEGALFGHRSGKRSLSVKWKKNAFRTFLAVVCALISIVGSTDLDKFVAIVGSVACVPLVYIYPALLHFKAVARSRWVQAGDLLLIVVGFVAMGYTTAVTIYKWSEQ